MSIEFVGFPKMARLSREVVITEKIDGTNAQVFVDVDGTVYAGSKSRWLMPGKQTDNFGFAAWVEEHKDELKVGLGPGRHFGEWWGKGIQRGYGLDERRFSLFNVERWEAQRPACCYIVPVLYRGAFDTTQIDGWLFDLAIMGSAAAPGFKDPEGVVIWHTAANIGFKKTLGGDGAKGATHDKRKEKNGDVY